MSPTPPSQAASLPAELQAVAEAARMILDAEANVSTNETDIAEARAGLQAASIAAIQAGHPVGQIAAAEASGQDAARAKLRGELIKEISRATRRIRDATASQDQAIRRADRAGLSHREIAHAAEVAPATIRSQLGRSAATAGNGDGPAAGEDLDGNGAVASVGEGHAGPGVEPGGAPVGEGQPAFAASGETDHAARQAE